MFSQFSKFKRINNNNNKKSKKQNNNETKAVLKLSKKLINVCNEILKRKEDKCQCYNSKNHPSKNIRECVHRNNNRNCKSYNKCKTIFSKLTSGDEPEYDPDDWSDPPIEGSHNCYAYMVNEKDTRIKNKCLDMCRNNGHNNKNCRTKKNKVNSCSNLKPQPGNYYRKVSGAKKERIYQCPQMIQKVLNDNLDPKTKKSNIMLTTFDKKCPKRYYKGALVVDPDHTYHFYRQDSNVRFSHKQGTLRVENVDASKNPIYVPHLSDMNYNKKKKSGGINYTDFCTYFCIPKNDYIRTPIY